MIYTITLNPSIDYYISINEELMDNEVNRSEEDWFKAGGKGINVSILLDKFKIKSKAIVLLGGFTGDYIKNELKKYENIETIVIPVDSPNRINVKIHNDEKAICVNGKGPEADSNIENRIFDELNNLKKGDWVMLCGKSMRGISNEFNIRLSKMVKAFNANLVIDQENTTLESLMMEKPSLIKPNIYEFGLLINKKKVNINELGELCDEVLSTGLERVLISLGEDGAYYASKEKKIRLHQKPIKAINKVGSGDAMLAMFVGKLSQGETVEDALRWSAAAGAAVARTLDEISVDDVEELYNMTWVE